MKKSPGATRGEVENVKKQRKSKPELKVCAVSTQPADSTEHLHVGQDGRAYKQGKALRASPLARPVPWHWKQTSLPNGEITTAVVGPFSPDTLSTIKYEYLQVEPELLSALVVAREHPEIRITALRQMFPELAKRLFDRHFQQIKDSEVRRGAKITNLKRFVAGAFSDAIPRYDEDTFYDYLKRHHSRQIKKPNRGRPRK